MEKEIKKLDFNYNIVKDLWEKPITRVVLIVGAIVLLIYVSGHLMSICANTIRSYKGFRGAISA